LTKLASSVVESLSSNAGPFAERYSHDRNFIQRYHIWTNKIDDFSAGVSTAYDMGCGSGIFSFYLASKGIQTVGFDGAEGMIELCNKHREELHLTNPNFKLAMLPIADYSSLPKVDLIISSSVIEYIDDIDSIIRMFHGLLKPNGKLIVSFPNKDAFYRKIEVGLFRLFKKPAYFRFVKNIWTRQEAEKAFRKAGFRMMDYCYFSDRSVISRMAGVFGGLKRSGNLTMMVFEKQK